MTNTTKLNSTNNAIRVTKKTRRPVVLIDFDDVIGDFMGLLVSEYNEKFGTSLKVEDFKEWDFGRVAGPGIFDIFKEEGFFTKIQEKNNSTSVLQQLIGSDKYEVLIVTACSTPIELNEKIEWIKEKVPTFNSKRIIMCSEKSYIRGDVLIDDKIENLDECSEYMNCIIYDMPHNQNCAYDRISSLEQLPEILDDMFYSNEKLKA